MNDLNKNIEALTEKQRKTVKTLIQLGDSKELAYKTVVNTKEHNSDMYALAYYS